MKNEMMNKGMGMCPMCEMGGGPIGMFIGIVLFIAVIAVLVSLSIYLIRKSKV
tara:strand:+ start:896 stop:1054 length:159 start_codon:yes stop_codon:yes gene_type:complete